MKFYILETRRQNGWFPYRCVLIAVEHAIQVHGVDWLNAMENNRNISHCTWFIALMTVVVVVLAISFIIIN